MSIKIIILFVIGGEVKTRLFFDSRAKWNMFEHALALFSACIQQFKAYQRGSAESKYQPFQVHIFC